MRVVQLIAENVKRIKAVDISPEDDVVVIAGRNAQGKSSVIDSIWFALGGGNATRDTPRPIRDGEDEASVTLDLGDFIVTRSWKGEKTTLAVMSKDGAKYPSPQAFLDEKIGALSFDPLAFSAKPAKDQRRLLLDVVATDLDVDDVDRKRLALFDQRTDVNRRLRDTEGALAELPKIPEDLPEEELSASVLIDQRESVLHNNAKRQKVRDEIAKTAAIIASIRAELEREMTNLVALEGVVEADEEVPDTTAELERIETTNALIRTRRDRDMLEGDFTAMRDRAQELTDSIALLDRAKQHALESAKLPIEGLAFDQEGVTYQGVPFKQCSGAEQLRVSIAMAMALNPTIRVIRISDGSLLDSENMSVIADLAAKQDFQIWIERVDEGSEVGFTIEDGEVVG